MKTFGLILIKKFTKQFIFIPGEPHIDGEPGDLIFKIKEMK